jgi:peroxiredoxin
MRIMRVTLAVVVASSLSIAACDGRPPKDPSVAAASPALDDPELVGTTPSEWTTEKWMNSGPLDLQDLRGRVVLVRWFMANDCPYCTGTAPALEQLHQDYAPRGLVVVGLYHHRGRRSLEEGEYENYVRRYGFTFPVAVDVSWSTLERWWMRGHRRAFTSVTFILDKQGRVRAVHPGPRFAPGDEQYLAIRGAVETLLAE